MPNQWLPAPTGPGWWWFKNSQTKALFYIGGEFGDDRESRLVSRAAGVLVYSGHEHAPQVSNGSVWGIQDFDGKWYGPIPEPFREE